MREMKYDEFVIASYLSKKMEFPTIVISTDGHTTEAIKIQNGQIVSKAEAKCDFRYDKFNFNTGAKIALDRLTKEIPYKDKPYNGKALCYDVHNQKNVPGCFKENKIYQFKDGYPLDVDNKVINNREVSAITNRNMETNTGWTKDWFIPIKED